MRRSALREAWTFVALTFATSYPVWFYIAAEPSRQRLIPFAMFLPALCAVVTKLALRGSFRDMGWRLPNWKWMLAGWLIPLGYSIVAYLPLIVVPALGGVARAAAPSPLAAIADFFYIGTYVVLIGLVSAAGEEIGWRGLLVPTFAQAYGERRSAIFSGMIWAAWHYPLVILGVYHGRNPMWFSVFAFSLAAIAAGIFLAWLRLRSGSLWPGVVAHSAHNSIVQAFFDKLITPTALNGYLAGEFGLLLAVAIGLVAAWCWPRLLREPALRSTSADLRPGG